MMYLWFVKRRWGGGRFLCSWVQENEQRACSVFLWKKKRLRQRRYMAVTGVIPSSKPEESTLWSNGNVLSNLNLPWPPPPPPLSLSYLMSWREGSRCPHDRKKQNRMILVSPADWCHITIWLDLDDLICCSDRLTHTKAAQRDTSTPEEIRDRSRKKHVTQTHMHSDW